RKSYPLSSLSLRKVARIRTKKQAPSASSTPRTRVAMRTTSAETGNRAAPYALERGFAPLLSQLRRESLGRREAVVEGAHPSVGPQDGGRGGRQDSEAGGDLRP